MKGKRKEKLKKKNRSFTIKFFIALGVIAVIFVILAYYINTRGVSPSQKVLGSLEVAPVEMVGSAT